MTSVPLNSPEPEQPIFSYSRAQAIADGVLVDVSETATELGFKIPMVITADLHACLTPSRADQAHGQDYDGRLWDVLWLAALSIRLNDRYTDTVRFNVLQQETDSKTGRLQTTSLHLWAVCSLGDEGEPVITVGFPQDF
jgi:hypothetical protein